MNDSNLRFKMAIPLSLTTLRLGLGPLALALAMAGCPHILFLPLLTAGMLSDYFDGALARRLGVVRPWLRRFDSITDLIFYLCILASAWLAVGATLRQNLVLVGLLLASEAVCILISLIRFRVFATHCYSAKVYGLALFFTFVAVLGFDSGSWPFVVLTVLGLIANAEVTAILLLSRHAPVDVPTMFHLNPAHPEI